MACVKRFSKINAISMGFSWVLQFVGFVTPWWFRQSYTFVDVNSGVWYSTTCYNILMKTCEMKQHLDSKDYMKGFHPKRPLQVQLTIALTACVFVVVLSLKTRKCTGTTLMKRLAVNAYMSVVSGVLCLSPLSSVVANQFFWTGNVQYLFLYSAVLTCLGGILALIVSFISLHQIRLVQTTNEPVLQLSTPENQDDYNSTSSLSDDAKVC
ncbi:uncharacterized protein LOC123524819 [Mercenaria mercenaria]|uniref:uncharacterized protein LOC123524819 n=1 Tax=Mercenaria mercenaria TaxID=6596 RepID=UPI00234ECC71|nr:uncharacterized protein LOC123524819 [Mercenaria mercenaria]